MAGVLGSYHSEVINQYDGVTDGYDTIYGLGGNDQIYGLGGDDFISGGAGADAIHSGMGTDTAFYLESSVGVNVSLASRSGRGGTAEGDTLFSIENLDGSYYGDVLTGDDGANRLRGYSGDDVLKGGGGDDDLWGEDGNGVRSRVP